MMENHSFDQMLGSLQSVFPDLDGVDIEASQARWNPDATGARVFQSPTDAQQVVSDPKHETVDVLDQLENHNSGFVTNFQAEVRKNTEYDRQQVMGYYPVDFLPALHQLGRGFAVCDRWFSSLPGPTWPNRFFALSGTSCGRVLMPDGIAHPRPGEFVAQDQTTLFDRLNEKGRSWKVYFYDFPISLLFNHQRRLKNLARYSLIKNFFKDVSDESTFPDFVFIEPKYLGADQNDDHPPHNIFKAQKLVADVYNAIRSSPQLWESTLLVITYDEHGGFYDHVEPPAAVPPDAHREEWTFDRLGVRVPAILVSPWVGAGPQHTQFDHTSLLKYLIEKWGLGPLGARTAAANSIGIAFDQSTRRDDTPAFIRVPYSDLMPERPELEQEDLSRHHQAINAFAAFLAKEEGVVTAHLVDALVREAGWIERARVSLGRAVHSVGRWLMGPLARRQSGRNSAAAAVARRVLSSADAAPGETTSPGQSLST